MAGIKITKKLVIGIDFDGTVVRHEYPKIGKDIGAIPVLKKLINAGHKLILITMRDESSLGEAVDYLTGNGVTLWGVNKNPSQHYWTSSPKIYANWYIDDAAIGIPCIYDKDILRYHVDWKAVEQILLDRGILPNTLDL